MQLSTDSKIVDENIQTYRKSTLKNGMRVVTEYMPHVRSVSLGVWIEAGSRDETAENSGISHFIEHMLFKGTEKRNTMDIAGSLEDVGGQLNAFTSKELSCYSAHILDEHLPLAIDVLSDILLHSRFLSQDIQKEKLVILNEIDHYRETPEEIVFEKFYENMFPEHPLGYLIYGTEKTISKFSRADILNYLKNNYTQGRIVIAAAGNLIHDEFVSTIETKFAGFPEHSKFQRSVPSLTPRATEQHDTCAQAHVCIGAKSVSYNNIRKFPLLILDTVFGSGMSSRLFQIVREQYGAAYSIYSFVDFYSDTGVFGVYVGTDPSKKEQCIELILNEFKRMRNIPLKEEELQKAKSQLKGNLVLGLEGTGSRMHRLAKMELYLHDYFSVDYTLNKIDSVTIQDVQDIACELFSEGSLYTTQLLPSE